MTHLKEGDPAPDFRGQNEKGEPIALSDFRGKKLILFFYPRDNTPGCTAEACNLRDNFELLKEKGFALLGVSPDSVKKHQNFSKKYEFPFPLLADIERTVINAYGVWGEKKFMGRVFDGVLRTTFIIDEEGKIEKIFTDVKTDSHAEQIVNSMAEL